MPFKTIGSSPFCIESDYLRAAGSAHVRGPVWSEATGIQTFGLES